MLRSRQSTRVDRAQVVRFICWLARLCCDHFVGGDTLLWVPSSCFDRPQAIDQPTSQRVGPAIVINMIIISICCYWCSSAAQSEFHGNYFICWQRIAFYVCDNDVGSIANVHQVYISVHGRSSDNTTTLHIAWWINVGSLAALSQVTTAPTTTKTLIICLGRKTTAIGR